MLCGLCGRIDLTVECLEKGEDSPFIDFGYDGPYPEEIKQLIDNDLELQKWWENHKEVDRRRAEGERKLAEREQKRKDAMKKLSDEERELLGLNPKSNPFLPTDQEGTWAH
jgi:uncharacterized protein YdcH (DUF465 family)